MNHYCYIIHPNMETRTDRSCSKLRLKCYKKKKNVTELNMYKEALSLQLN